MPGWGTMASPIGPKVRREGQRRERNVLNGLWASTRKNAHCHEIPAQRLRAYRPVEVFTLAMWPTGGVRSMWELL